MNIGGTMRADTIRDKHLKLDQGKIDSAKKILGVKTETEAVNTALDMVIRQNGLSRERHQLVKRILKRREGLGRMSGDIAEWVREGRKERDKSYGA
jgi:hypothetical protein